MFGDDAIVSLKWTHESGKDLGTTPEQPVAKAHVDPPYPNATCSMHSQFFFRLHRRSHERALGHPPYSPILSLFLLFCLNHVPLRARDIVVIFKHTTTQK